LVGDFALPAHLGSNDQEGAIFRMKATHLLRQILWRFGYDICRFNQTSHPLARRKHFLENYNIDTVLDIGANSGQFASELRQDLGYSGRIISFEPLREAFKSLKAHASNDPRWETFNFAIGDVEEKREINIAGNSLSSSLLDILPSHLTAAPESKYVGKEAIEVRTLDSIFGQVCENAKHIYMKIDTQGFEGRVLKGAAMSLPRIDTIQIEMSLIPLYGTELLFDEMCVLMREKGYTLVAIENGFSAPNTAQLLQIDGIFRRL
jgi:FkbM family methyltransferase